MSGSPAQRPRRGRKLKVGDTATAPTTLVYSLSGRPYTEDGLALELRKLVAALHRAGRIDSERYDLHGLRHTRGVQLALAGCSDAEGAAMMGHGSALSFVQYRRQADRVWLADFAAARVSRLREQTGDGLEDSSSHVAARRSAALRALPEQWYLVTAAGRGARQLQRTSEFIERTNTGRPTRCSAGPPRRR